MKLRAAAAVFLIVAAIVAGEALRHVSLWAIIVTAACFLIALVIVAVLALLMTRPLRRREREVSADLERTRPARLAAMTGRPQVTQGTERPAIVNHYGPQFHIYGAAGQDAAAHLIRKALTEGDPDVPITS